MSELANLRPVIVTPQMFVAEMDGNRLEVDFERLTLTYTCADGHQATRRVTTRRGSYVGPWHIDKSGGGGWGERCGTFDTPEQAWQVVTGAFPPPPTTGEMLELINADHVIAAGDGEIRVRPSTTPSDAMAVGTTHNTLRSLGWDPVPLRKDQLNPEPSRTFRPAERQPVAQLLSTSGYVVEDGRWVFKG